MVFQQRMTPDGQHSRSQRGQRSLENVLISAWRADRVACQKQTCALNLCENSVRKREVARSAESETYIIVEAAIFVSEHIQIAERVVGREVLELHNELREDILHSLHELVHELIHLPEDDETSSLIETLMKSYLSSIGSLPTHPQV